MPGFDVAFANLLKARFPFIYIGTYEEERVLRIIGEVARDAARVRTPRAVFTWSVSEGLVGPALALVENTKAPLDMLEWIERHADPAIIVLKDFHVFFGADERPADFQVVRKLRDLAGALKRSAKPRNVVFLSPAVRIPVDLDKDVTVLEFALPGVEDMRALLNDMVESNRKGGRIAMDVTPADIDRLSHAALGLTLQEAENAFARAMVDDARLSGDDVETILEEKRQIVRKAGILEFVRSDVRIEDVGGLENLKRWLAKRDKSWLEAARKYELPAPKGVLITGVPGCGKSLLAKAIGAAWRLPLLRLDVGRVFGMYIGMSEQNLRAALHTAEAVAPCVLWIDEIEKGFSKSGDGDSGTSSRVFATLLTWMQEKTKPVFVIATANNIDALPPELMRKGRFDEIFFVDLPTRAERIEIFKVHMKRRLRHPEVVGSLKLGDEAYARLADATEGFIGAELEQVVIGALFEAYSEARAIDSKDFGRAIKGTVPLSVTQAERIRAIRDWANKRAVSATAQDDRAADTEPRGGRTVDF